MQAVRKTVKAPENGELRILLPDEVAPGTPIEVILIYGEPEDMYADKIAALKSGMDDELFQQDLTEIAGDFAAVDGEDWAR